MKKISLLTVLILSTIFLTFFLPQISFSQVIYTQTFDGSNSLPNGWTTNSNSWTIDSSNFSTGYNGASGLRNVVVQNSSSPAGKDSLITSSISTIGYANITVNWGARNTTHFSDSGSYIQGFYWSADHGTTWNGISYTENANNSTWSLDNGGNSISLPAGASNQSSLQFLWMASIATSSSGTYRIDDFDVTGTVATDVPVVAGSERFADIYFINSKVIYIAMHRAFNEAVTMELYDISGKLLDRQMMNSPNLTIDALAFSKGMYFVKLSTASQQMVSRIVVK